MADLVLEFTKNEWWSSNDRLHWAIKSKLTKNTRQKARLAALEAGLPRYRKAHVTAWISYPRTSRADPANLVGTVLKAAIDGCTDAGLWADDDSRNVIGPDPRRGPNTGRPGTWVVRLEIQEEAA